MEEEQTQQEETESHAGYKNLLEFTSPNQTKIVFASAVESMESLIVKAYEMMGFSKENNGGSAKADYTG